MRSVLKFTIPVLVASLTLAACGSSSNSSGSSSQAGATTPAGTASSSSGASTVLVKTASDTALGATVLVDAQGMTLYRLSGEQNGKFICTSSACLQVWHPLIASAGAPSGSVGSLATVKRSDGTEQVTYKGAPLYTFAQDQKPGDTNGQGIKDVGTWTVVKTGPQSSSTPATATPTQPENSGGGESSGGGYSY